MNKNIWPEKCIYKIGETGLQSTIYTDENGVDRVQHTENLTVAEYLQRENDPALVVMPFETAIGLITAAQNTVFLTGWKEIDEENYMDALECLPPMDWRTVDGVNFFHMSEMMTGDITATYATTGGRYFASNQRLSTPYSQLAVEIKEKMIGGVTK